MANASAERRTRCWGMCVECTRGMRRTWLQRTCSWCLWIVASRRISQRSRVRLGATSAATPVTDSRTRGSYTRDSYTRDSYTRDSHTRDSHT
eukprot:6271431-Pyramimonas_sp.AAC.1